ncbi:MAG: glycine--tRNA ligase subunit beta [Gammaproteobacteria bacterium]|nr:glycine--tRNA ligase subunit beta [Gammaproteobacteria bacterium]
MSAYSDFIVEVGTEELPPLSMETLAQAFHDELLKQIDESGLTHQQSQLYATPRRLAVYIESLAEAQEDKVIEKQGPAVAAAFNDKGEPTPAASGFARSCGVAVEDLQQIETAKGTRLAHALNQPGKPSADFLPKMVELALDKLPIAKSMRWGNNQHSFIRPVKWLLMMQGEKVIPANLFNCQSSNITHGHRFLAAGDLKLDTPKDYQNLLENHFVIADIDKRKRLIAEQVNNLARELEANTDVDPLLLNEVTALVEWPVALVGNFDKAFLAIPKEALISTMAKNQKYFYLEDKDQNLLPKFITIANIKSFNPKAIIQGNEKVIRPRLADAKFFYDHDCKHSLTSKTPKLGKVVFQKQLGTLLDKTLRIKSLATAIAKDLSDDVANIEKAATICKTDLITDMVGEFPSLQGTMGRYYATHDGENKEVAIAMEEIYMPRFAGDILPSSKTGRYLALADRLDTIVGIFAIGQIPSGNKDPFALRRAVLGILRIIIEKNLPLDLIHIIQLTVDNYKDISVDDATKKQILDFFNGRLKAMYLEKGYSNTVIQSVLILNVSSPLDFDARIQAVNTFNQIQEANSLAEANKRVANILAKNAGDFNIENIDATLLTSNAETELVSQINLVAPKVEQLCGQQDYTAALSLLAELKPQIDNFFDTVMVMDEDMSLRQNRLAILNQLRNLFIAIADISCLQK